MPTLELVCKRLFADSPWFLKCIVGALLLVIPIAQFFVFGYLYALIERARRGDTVILPDWGEWKRLFYDGIVAFVIFLVLGVLPIAVAWLLTLPLRVFDFGGICLPSHGSRGDGRGTTRGSRHLPIPETRAIRRRVPFSGAGRHVTLRPVSFRAADLGVDWTISRGLPVDDLHRFCSDGRELDLLRRDLPDY